jgi:peptidoglycan/LPS O-acetylase OafA/YrhL
MDLQSLFIGLQESPIGVFVKDKAATFAIIEAVHLLAWTLLGGTVLATDLRLLGAVLRDVPSKVVSDSAHTWFKVALFTLLITGFFMLAGVAEKCYHNFYFWVKMIALLTGIVFVFAIKQPLLRNDHATLSPITLKLVGLASISLWLLVAASGRWIGFS